MSNLNEKRWFVYLGDHHEGPFSLGEIHNKMHQGSVSQTNYVWCEGMSDWKQMTDVGEFKSILNGSTSDENFSSDDVMTATGSAAVHPIEDAGALMHENTSAPQDFQSVQTSVPEENLSADEGGQRGYIESLNTENDQRVQVEDSPVTPHGVIRGQLGEKIEGGSRWSRWTGFRGWKGAQGDLPEPDSESKRAGVGKLFFRLCILAVIALLGAGALGFLDPVLKNPAVQNLTQMVTGSLGPAFKSLLGKLPFGQPSLPKLSDVVPEEFAELETAVTWKLSQGPKGALALMRKDPTAPAFYVASNLGDQARFEIRLVGVSDTLLNVTDFNQTSVVTLKDHLATTEVFHYPDGRPLPMGQYTVYLFESDQQPTEIGQPLSSAPLSDIQLPADLPQGRKIVMIKSYFLGGVKDSSYAERLKKYHGELQKRARDELLELQNFAAVLINQYNQTNDRFYQLTDKKPKTPFTTQKWNTFHTEWTRLGDHLVQEFQKWTPEIINSRFYREIYQLTKDSGVSLYNYHAKHHQYFIEKIDLQTFNPELESVKNQAFEKLRVLKDRINSAKQLIQNPTPSGMPRREGQ